MTIELSEELSARLTALASGYSLSPSELAEAILTHNVGVAEREIASDPDFQKRAAALRFRLESAARELAREFQAKAEGRE